MTVAFPAAHFELKIARSDFIDAYNAADLAVRRRLVEEHAAQKPMIADNLMTLSKLAAGPQYSKAEKKRVDALVVELHDLKSARCDIVHSRMQLLAIDDLEGALFANVQKKQNIGRSGLLLTIAEIRKLTTRLSEIAEALPRPKAAVNTIA